MYYIMSDKNKILESIGRPPTEDELQAEANYFHCSVYVIDGEHYGMTADPEDKEDEDETP